MFMKSTKMHNGAVFAIGLDGKWLFTGGLDKTVNVQVKYDCIPRSFDEMKLVCHIITLMISYKIVFMSQEWSCDEFQIDFRPIGSIPCDSVITTLLCWQGMLFVGYANKNITVIFFFFFHYCDVIHTTVPSIILLRLHLYERKPMILLIHIHNLY